MSIHQRRAAWVISHGSPEQARRAALYGKHQTKTTTAAMELLFSRVCAA